MPFNLAGAAPYDGEIASELVLTPATERPAISENFTVVEGLKGKRTVQTLGRASKVTHKDPGCGLGKRQITLPASTVTWDPQDMKAWIWECWATLRGKVLEWKLKTLDDKSDLTQTDIEVYLVDVLTDAAYVDLLRFGWFGNKTIIGANLTGGVNDVENYNGFDGIFTRIFQGVAANKIKYVPIADNAEATIAGQALEPGDAFPIFQNIFNKQPAALVTMKNKKFQVTNSLFTEYLSYRESQNLDNSYDIQESGTTTLRYRGTPITVVSEWDEFIQADFRVSGRYDLPHRALLSAPGIFQLGFDAVPFQSQGDNPFNIWYNIDDEIWNARMKYMADSQISDPALMIAAY